MADDFDARGRFAAWPRPNLCATGFVVIATFSVNVAAYADSNAPQNISNPAIAAGSATDAKDKDKNDKSSQPPEDWSIHGQFTNVTSAYPSFPSAYSGSQSLPPYSSNSETITATLFLGRRLWDGAAVYVNPEIDQGVALGHTFGVAAFPSGESYKVDSPTPYPRLQRWYFQQTINLGGTTEDNPAAQNQLAGPLAANRLTFTLGALAVTDLFDNNAYAHDPRNDFLNWAIIDMGAFDYASNSWGYSVGTAAEWRQDWWTARAGVFQMSGAGMTEVDPVPFREWSSVAEFEERHTIFGQPGKVRFLAYGDYAYLGDNAEAVALAATTGMPADYAPTREKRAKFGGGINVEQQIMPDLGFFARVSKDDGRYEDLDFTDIDESISTGVVLTGARWTRDKDSIGLAGVINGLDPSHRAYFEAGGLGQLVGDGAMNYAPERVMEAFYRCAINDNLSLTGDYQLVANPAYNQVRGPVHIFTMRVHAEF